MTPLPQKPNVLLIITDQHRFDHLGYAGQVPVRTPNLDRLAQEGMIFSNTYVANPTCAPNRASLFTGRYPSVHGLRFNGLALDPATTTFPGRLKANGYRTCLVGKSHLQPYGIKGPVPVDSVPPASESHLPPGWDQYENDQRHQQECVQFPEDYYGFESIDLVTGHSDSCGGHYYQWLLKNGVDPTSVQGQANALSTSALWHQVYETAVPAELYPTKFIVETLKEKLKAFSRQTAPFFAVASFPDPHHPFTPPGEYWGCHQPSDMPLPSTFHDKHERSLPHIQQMREKTGTPDRPYNGWAVTEEQYREALAAELGMIEMIDDAVGELIEQLAQNGQLENTVVIFTSDHGDMFGDHGLMLKHAMHYDAALHVPLLISGSGVPSGVYDGLVSTLDLSSTILDLAAVDEFSGMQGKSLVPTFTNPSETIRMELMVEEDEAFSLPGYPGPIRMRTLIDVHGRLTYCHGQKFGEFYDRRQDPDEMNNIFSSDAPSPEQLNYERHLMAALVETAESGTMPTSLG